MDDLGNLGAGEHTLVDKLTPNLGSPRANWTRNSSVLREEMRKGVPIRDASAHLPDSHVLPDGRTVPDTFLGMERNVLDIRWRVLESTKAMRVRSTNMKDETNFCNVVKSAFSFLIERDGFRVSRESSTTQIEYVEYRSELVYVRVTCTGPDFEPKMVFGRNDREGVGNGSSFDWIDLKELDCCQNWTWRSNSDKPYDDIRPPH